MAKYKIETPIYINTRFNYFCDDCEMAELEIESDNFYNNGKVYGEYHTLTCANYDTCKTLMHNLRYVQKAERKEE